MKPLISAHSAKLSFRARSAGARRSRRRRRAVRKRPFQALFEVFDCCVERSRVDILRHPLHYALDHDVDLTEIDGDSAVSNPTFDARDPFEPFDETEQESGERWGLLTMLGRDHLLGGLGHDVGKRPKSR